MMQFLQAILADGRAALPIERHEDFVAALRYSLVTDPRTYTPKAFDRYGFTQHELCDLNVLPVRSAAYAFMTALGSRISRSRFDKMTTIEVYMRHFKREPWLISKKPRVMLLTYAEWMDLTLMEPVPVPLPKELDLGLSGG